MQAKLAGSASPALTGRHSLYAELMATPGKIEGESILGGLNSACQPLKMPELILATSLMLALGVAGWSVMLVRPAAIVPDKPVAGLVTSLPATPSVTSQAAHAVIVANADVSATPVKTTEAQSSEVAPEQSLGSKEELVPPVATAVQVLNTATPATISPTIAAPGRPASKTVVPKKAPAIASASDAVSKAKPEETWKSVAPGTLKKNRKNAGNQESASQKASDSIMAQLERCSALGFFEAEMCRLRVCTGRWGSDPGCPEHAQISSAAP